MADASDSKSDAGNSVWVQVPSPAVRGSYRNDNFLFCFPGGLMRNDSMAVELFLIHTDFLEDEEVFRLKLKQVSEKRRNKVLQYKTREDQKRSLAAGLLLEEILRNHGFHPNAMETDDNGKLYLPEVDNFFFSLSHSGEYAACVVCDVPVGVDIEKKRMTKANIAKRFFQIKESDKIEKQPPEKRDDMFFRYWTGKESYLKLTGKGILGGLDSFFVDLDEKKIIDEYNHNQEIYLKEYKCLEDYYISVACYSKKFATFVKKIYYRL